MNLVIRPSATETTTACAGDIPEVPKAGVDFTLATGGRRTLDDVGVAVVGIALDNGDPAAPDEAAADGAGADEAGALPTGATVIGATVTDPADEPPADEAVEGDPVEGELIAVEAFPPEVHAVTSTISPRTAAIGDRRRADDIKGTRLTDQQPPGGTRAAHHHRQPPM